MHKIFEMAISQERLMIETRFFCNAYVKLCYFTGSDKTFQTGGNIAPIAPKRYLSLCIFSRKKYSKKDQLYFRI